ncbi:MAG: sigma 54-interacting transcriptional regulator [Myxococcota bacterium]|nr:sigma 54-interacting transcriptional regulator [Myxococcota bacterium]
MPYFKCTHLVQRQVQNFTISKTLTTIGRKSDCDIQLNDAQIGELFATLRKRGNQYQLRLIDLSTPTLLNGSTTRGGENLASGDRIMVGSTELIFLDGDPPEVSGNSVENVKGLQQLVDFSSTLMHNNEPTVLFKELLKAIMDITHAEKGFIIVLQDDERHLAATRNVDNTQLDLSRVSDTIINRVVEKKEPVIVSDAMSDSRFGNAMSVVDLKVSSVMCVPMLYRNHLLGVIYLGNDAIRGLFTEADLTLLTVFASQASMIVHTALMLNELRLTNQNLLKKLEQSGQGQIIGSSPPMQGVFKLLRKLGPSDLSILVLGETGTGKELVARELHRLSSRSDQPFISINCGAIPENLLESELFGHNKGSFTGAVSDKMGKFEVANGGTIFLDEIGEMPMSLQVKLLRVLQERVIERVGDLEPRPINIRVVSATNKDLQEEIKEGRFREDLFYRLAEVSVNLPPLRERGMDIHELAMFFLNKYSEQYNSKVNGFKKEAIKLMQGYYWPGNVRQLESRIKRAVIMSDEKNLNAEDVGIAQNDTRTILPLDLASENFKIQYIKEALEINNWNKAQTARDLDVDPRTIFRYIEKLQ